jgi:hypothetical protein
MSDRKEEILSKYPELIAEVNDEDNCAAVSIENAKDAMDEYMKECCLELLEYMAKNKVVCGVFSDDRMFNYKGQWITKEQLFENFL